MWNWWPSMMELQIQNAITLNNSYQLMLPTQNNWRQKTYERRAISINMRICSSLFWTPMAAICFTPDSILCYILAFKTKDTTLLFLCCCKALLDFCCGPSLNNVFHIASTANNDPKVSKGKGNLYVVRITCQRGCMQTIWLPFNCMRDVSWQEWNFVATFIRKLMNRKGQLSLASSNGHVWAHRNHIIIPFFIAVQIHYKGERREKYQNI